MRVLVACEFSGIVRDAFIAKGHDAWSCDTLHAEGHHIQGDVRFHLSYGWDLMIAHPPCTYLCSSGLHWNRRIEGRAAKTEAALKFVEVLLYADIPKIALENPVGCISTRIRKPDQYIQPYEFGHPESKKTGLWLKNLPLLLPTKVCEPEYYTLPDGTVYRDKRGHRYSKTHYHSFRSGKSLARWANQTPSGQNKLGPSPTRGQVRSVTYQGIADAMAEQWGDTT